MGTLAVAFVYTWVFNNTGGSILLAALLHAAINMSSGLVLIWFPGYRTRSMCSAPRPA